MKPSEQRADTLMALPAMHEPVSGRRTGAVRLADGSVRQPLSASFSPSICKSNPA